MTKHPSDIMMPFSLARAIVEHATMRLYWYNQEPKLAVWDDHYAIAVTCRASDFLPAGPFVLVLERSTGKVIHLSQPVVELLGGVKETLHNARHLDQLSRCQLMSDEILAPLKMFLQIEVGRLGRRQR